MSVAGKVVLITGAARGLGFEYARSLGAAGAIVVAGDVRDCADAAAAAGNGAIGVTLDVADMVSAEAMAAAAVERFGRIDALVNNAALYGSLRGGRFNQMALTAAHPWLPLGTKVLVTVEETGRAVVVTITDRLPSGRRVIDVSLAAARVLGFVGQGLAEVSLAHR